MSSQPRAVDRIRESWRSFAGLQTELLEVALRQDGIDDGTLADLLGRLVGNIQYSGLQLAGDPARPSLIDAQHPVWNWGNSNPDTLYLAARVDSAHDYRVHGKLGSVAQTTFGIYTGTSDQSDAVKVRAEDLDVGPDGSFEVFFTREPCDGNWFGLPDGARSFASYQTFSDWENQRQGTLHIECLDPVGPVIPIGPFDAADRFDAHLAESRELFTMWIEGIPARILGSLPLNEAMPPFQPPVAMAGAWFSPIPWQLDDGQALVIDYEIPENSPYVGICLTNRWSQMIDAATRQTSLTLSQSRIDDGRIRVLLACEDVGVRNWLDARGYRNGVATWRATTPVAPPAPSVTKIALADVDDFFDPSDRLTDDERASDMAARLRHFERRGVL